MTSFRELNASRIALHEKEMQLVDERASALRDSLVDARAALARAQQAVDAMTCDLADLDAMRSSLRDKVQELRVQLDPRVMESFPAELLRAIFFAFASIMDIGLGCFQHCSIRNYNLDRALVPFTLSSVCRRWRHVSFDSPSLWGLYLALPEICTQQDATRAQQYVDIILRRSQSSLLDISIDWDGCDPWVPAQDSILRSIGSHAERWRSIMILLPTEEMNPERLKMFQRRTPNLEEVVAYVQTGDVRNPWRENFPVYLPYCPKLQQLRTDGAHLILTEPRSPVPSITRIRLEFVDLPPRVLWHMLQLCPALVSLHIDVAASHSTLDSWRPSSQLRLHALEYLGLSRRATYALFATWAAFLDFPNLSTIALQYSVPQVQADRIFSHIGRTATSLKISENANLIAGDLSWLSKLLNLRCFEFRSSHSLPAEFFARWASESAWPRLEAFSFWNNIFSVPTAEALIRSIRSRHEAQTQRSQADAVQQLKSVALIRCNVPVWLKDELSSLGLLQSVVER